MRNTASIRLLICLLSLTFAFTLYGQQRRSQPGEFDYYLLTLSWSPEFCHGHPSDVQCTGSKHYGFVVHGLWPEFAAGGYPQYCSRAPGLTNPTTMLDIMPDPALINHEWMTHGTCSGLDADRYFGLIRNAFASIHIPPQFAAAKSQFSIAPSALIDAFANANSNLPASAIQVTCNSGVYLNSVEICLRKDLTPMPCPNPRNCRARTIRVPPVR